MRFVCVAECVPVLSPPYDTRCTSGAASNKISAQGDEPGTQADGVPVHAALCGARLVLVWRLHVRNGVNLQRRTGRRGPRPKVINAAGDGCHDAILRQGTQKDKTGVHEYAREVRRQLTLQCFEGFAFGA